ncbi:hypothetical protein IQ06DRAFT_94783 [Phaeosphaeriaceae sp. SRC1lsM3a]|nr:hypothetical protein IQ06DRAFT_94783 [Stagonospora sp. SRC1lsM3a]
MASSDELRLDPAASKIPMQSLTAKVAQLSRAACPPTLCHTSAKFIHRIDGCMQAQVTRRRQRLVSSRVSRNNPKAGLWCDDALIVRAVALSVVVVRILDGGTKYVLSSGVMKMRTTCYDRMQHVVECGCLMCKVVQHCATCRVLRVNHAQINRVLRCCVSCVAVGRYWDSLELSVSVV